MDAFWKDLVAHLDKLWIPFAEVAFGLVAGPLVKKWILRLSSKSLDKGAMTFLGSAANVVIILVCFILAVESLGVKLSSIVTLVSALGLGISLALKGNMANVAGGLQILVTKPFQVGDYIKISGHKGVVTAIELMFTTLKTDNNKEVVIPNNLLVTDLLTNFSKEPIRRIVIPFPVAVPADPEAIKKNALALIAEEPLLEKDPPVTIQTGSFSEGYINFEIIGYVKWQNYEACHYSLCTRLSDGLDAYHPKEKKAAS